MLRDKIRKEIEEENRYSMTNGTLVVALRTLGRVLVLPLRLVVKLYEWTYYDQTEEKLDRIRRGF